MKTSTTSRPQHTIKGDSKISICVTLITLLHSTITIYLTFTEVKKTFKATRNIDPKIIYAAYFKKLTKSKIAAKDKKPEFWSAATFQTLTRCKKSAKDRDPSIFLCKNVKH